MGPTPFYGARAEKTPFAIKQTNICRLSGDIKSKQICGRSFRGVVGQTVVEQHSIVTLYQDMLIIIVYLSNESICRTCINLQKYEYVTGLLS